jgi:hypothetical protein
VNVMLVKTIGYNLLSVCQLATMGYATYFDVDFVVVMWSKTLKVAFVGYVENSLYVVDFSEKPTTAAICLISRADVGWLASPVSPHQYEVFAKSLHQRPHTWTKGCFICQRSCL